MGSYASIDYTNCRHETKWRVGCVTLKSGEVKQRLRCMMCKQHFTEGRKRRSREQLIAILGPAYRAGLRPGRKVSKRVGVDQSTMQEYYRFFDDWISKRKQQL